MALPDGKERAEEVILLPDGREPEEIEEAEIVTGDPGEEFLTEEEKKEIQGEPEEQPEEEKKELILNFIEEKGEFKYKAGEVAESTGIETADCTRITINLIEENKIKMKKKGKSGKNGIYGSLLEVVTEA